MHYLKIRGRRYFIKTKKFKKSARYKIKLNKKKYDRNKMKIKKK